MARKVADLVADILQTTGVRRIFGVVGDSLNGLTEALRKRKAYRLDSRPPRRGRGLRGRGRSAAHRRACGLRRILRAGQPASHQRPVRLPPHPHAGAGDCRADSVRRDWRRLFSGDPSRRSCSGNAATIASWFPIRRSCPTCWRTPSARRSGGAAWRWSSSPATSRCGPPKRGISPNAGAAAGGAVVLPADASTALADFSMAPTASRCSAAAAAPGAHDEPDAARRDAQVADRACARRQGTCRIR